MIRQEQQDDFSTFHKNQVINQLSLADTLLIEDYPISVRNRIAKQDSGAIDYSSNETARRSKKQRM